MEAAVTTEEGRVGGATPCRPGRCGRGALALPAGCGGASLSAGVAAPWLDRSARIGWIGEERQIGTVQAHIHAWAYVETVQCGP